MGNNGLDAFAFHVDSATKEAVAGMSGPPFPGGAPAAPGSEPPDATMVARAYLQQGLASKELPQFMLDPKVEKEVGFSHVSTEDIPLTKCLAVKFRQQLDEIPVYGSLVTVEMDHANKLVSIHSSLGTPAGVDPVPKVDAGAAESAVRADAGIAALPVDSQPRLYFYFDEAAGRWRLTYIVENVPISQGASRGEAGGPVSDVSGAHQHRGCALPAVFDYVVDAHTGDIVKKLPRVSSVDFQTITLPDGLNRTRDIRVVPLGAGGLRLHDPELNVHTHDARFQDLSSVDSRLPGDYCGNPPEWLTDAVSAHANGAVVAQFVRDVLLRYGLDNRGEGYKASINCLWGPSGTGVWAGAAWYRNQAVFGQRQRGSKLVSYAVALDVVAHEFFHGITERTARLAIGGEPGALNESCSDIFAIIIANSSKPSPDDWDWEMGEELDATGIPLRDFRDPTKRNQPDHMRDYRKIEPPYHVLNDYGGVHLNSGIHNKAAYKILTAQEAGQYLFFPVNVAQIFYLALLKLSPLATFSQSRMAVENAAQSLMREDERRGVKMDAIRNAFDSVGIPAL